MVARGSADREVVDPTPLKIGQRIPGTRYRLVHALGRGGSAEVFAAQHVDLDRKVAIKVLSPKLAQSSEAIAQFRMEARACSRVSHPNIVDVIDFGELEDGRFFFAMELVEGASLADVLNAQATLPAGRAIGIFRQIAKGLAAAHEQGIVHRDVKPENVMLVSRDGRDDIVKLVDFGVMAFTSDTARIRVGTPGYMAPEQVSGEPPRPAMDIYALGSTLYEVLCGQTPYPAEPTDEFIRRQSSSPPPALRSRPGAEQIPAGLERVVHRALERDPTARHTSMSELEADLLVAQRQAGLTTDWDDLPTPGSAEGKRRATPRATPAPRPADRRPALLYGALAAIAIAVAISVLVWKRAAPPPSPAPVARGGGEQPGMLQPTARPELAPAIKALLARIDAATEAGHFTHPEGKSALDLIDDVLQRAPDNPDALRARRRIARMLESAADRLRDYGLPISARTLYQEALLFAPESARLQALAYPEPEQRPRKRQRPPIDATRIAWLVNEIQLAVAQGRLVAPQERSALRFLTELKRIDPSGKRSAEVRQRMTRTLRQDADRLWEAKQRGKARRVYQLITLLHPGDALARQRATPDAGPTVATAERATNNATRSGTDPEVARTLVQEGRKLLRQGKLRSARTRFLAAVKADAKSAAAVVGLATVSFEQAAYAQAVELAERATKLNRRELRGYLLLGDAYFKLLRYDDALAAWQRVLTLAPGNKRATQRIAMVKARRTAAP